MVAKDPAYELSAEKLTEAALRVGRINYAYLRAAKRSSLTPSAVYDLLRIGYDLSWVGGSGEFRLFRSTVCELIAQRINPINCLSSAALVEAASQGSVNELSRAGRHIAGCRYCREEVESMQPVMAPS